MHWANRQMCSLLGLNVWRAVLVTLMPIHRCIRKQIDAGGEADQGLLRAIVAVLHVRAFLKKIVTSCESA